MSPEDTCAVCGRTILAGERVHGYFTADGRRGVCELCVSRAEKLGWRHEDEAEAPVAAGKQRGGGLGSFWRRRARRQPDAPPPTPAAPSLDPAAPGMRVEQPPFEPSPLSPFERATARFNLSEAGHTVAGLARTLGTPAVSVGASAGAPNEIRITVAWELSWYQWGVDLGDELRPVFQIDKGNEIDQLDAAARQWNAAAVEGGRIVLGAPSGDPAIDGAPARR